MGQDHIKGMLMINQEIFYTFHFTLQTQQLIARPDRQNHQEDQSGEHQQNDQHITSSGSYTRGHTGCK